MAHIVLGILAHNEAERIASTIGSLFQQDVFRDSRHKVDIVLVANGCKDATEAAASNAAASAIRSEELEGRASFGVMSIPAPGKCHAWNAFVHSSSVPAGCLVGLMDADILLPEPSTLTHLVDDLLSDPELRVAVSRPVKHFRETSSSRLAQALSRGVSGDDPHTICGQLYLTREDVVRDIWLPNRLQVEDGFLRAMIVTSQFRNADEPWRVRWSKNAYHHYEPYLKLGQLIRHETWLVSNAAACAHIYSELWKLSGDTNPGGRIIKSLNESSPGWVEELLRARVGNKLTAVPIGILSRRLSKIRGLGWKQVIKKLPTTLAATILDWAIYIKSNRRVRHWIRSGDMRSNQSHS